MQLTKLYVIEDWYKYMVEDCQAILTERIKKAREEKILAYAEVGERIYNDPNYKKYSKDNVAFLNRLFDDIGIGRRSGYYAIEFYAKYLKGQEVVHGVQNLPFDEGENISWDKIKNKYLTEKKEVSEDHLITCPNCNFKFKL